MPKFKKLKYRHKIALIIFIFTLLPMLVLGSFLTVKIWNSKVKDILEVKNAQLTSSVVGINSLLSANTEKMIYINKNYYINNYLETNSDQNLLGIMNFSDYLQSVMAAVKSDNSQTDVAIYALKDTNYDGEYLRSIQSLENEIGSNGMSIKDEVLKLNDGEIMWEFRSAKPAMNSDFKADYIFAYKKIESLNKPLAIIEMRIPFNQIISFFKYDIPKGSTIVYEADKGEKNIIIRTSQAVGLPIAQTEQQLYLDEDKLSKYYVLSLKLYSEVGNISMFIPRSLVFQELKLYWVTVIVIFLVIIAFLIFTVEVVSYFLTKKLEVLFRKMNKKSVESLINNNDMQFNKTQDEFGTIGNVFYELTVKIKEYYKQITDYELERKVLETQLLQERFNPHFLYNTLSTIRWITEDTKVKEVVNSMVRYYRIALNKGSSIITITQELEMIEEYLRLQKFAYGNEFEFVIEMEEGIGNYLILKHLLQPVVENAVLHGLNGRETGGIIRIHARNYEGDIAFDISDNGAGMDSEKLEKVLNGSDDGTYGGYGMENIRKRMEIFYGSGYGIEIVSIQDQGTTVIIRIPAFLNANIQMSMKSIL
ncbi:hypothetical protein EHS13_08940 [Paenibacillus psychroresistens]|uniref:Histidine kinase domain-containing protein n=1 Tax=Paenibacillus psychroresistens TaxID=1778678 RepID=A0A6B8RFQ1_9BACL|nr:histidine kinase [Paenibacillus psychroresistens]QGQ95000.1 hypothetical protein EHS13_08940 [Paenibacillus psychroresistens]